MSKEAQGDTMRKYRQQRGFGMRQYREQAGILILRVMGSVWRVNKKPLEVFTFTRTFTKNKAKPDKQLKEIFMQMKITFTLRKNGGYMPSSLGSRSFPVDRQQTKFLLLKKSCNLTSNQFFRYLNKFLTLYIHTNRSMPSFQAIIITRLFFGHIFGSHSFPDQSLLLSTTILNDTSIFVLFLSEFWSGPAMILLILDHSPTLASLSSTLSPLHCANSQQISSLPNLTPGCLPSVAVAYSSMVLRNIWLNIFYIIM